MTKEVKLCAGSLIGIGALALLPALFSVLIVRHVGWLLYIATFLFLFVQWVRFLLHRRAFPSPRAVWAASTTYFAVTLLGMLGATGSDLWRFFQREPSTSDGNSELPFGLFFITLIVSCVPLFCMTLSVFLYRQSHECA